MNTLNSNEIIDQINSKANRFKRVVRDWMDARCLTFKGGIGDHLLLTIIARELRKRGVKNVFIVSEHAELFLNNGDISSVAKPGSRKEQLFVRLAGYDQFYLPRYDLEHDFVNDVGFSPREHIAGIMCRTLGITGEIAVLPRLSLTRNEKRFGESYHDAIAVQSGVLSAVSAIPNKQWLPERFARVTKELLKRHRVIQLGGDKDQLVPCSEDLRGRTTIRESAAILSHCRLYIGQVGLLMHVSRAVECPAVIIYGGRERPDQSGYSGNFNIYTDLPCAPCWNYSRCGFDHACMTRIQDADVLQAVTTMLARRRGPLPLDSIVV